MSHSSSAHLPVLEAEPSMSAPSRTELAAVVLDLSSKLSAAKLSQILAAYLVENRRTSELDAIMREVSRQREAQNGVTEVTATSAFKLNEATKKSIAGLMNSKQTIINEVVDASVLGGVRLETSELQLDLTVRNRLNQLKAAV